MHKLTFLTLIFGLIILQPLQAQYPYVRFENQYHEFGDIYESKGVASHDFIFQNVGEIPVFITEVTTTCGCTKPEYSNDTVMPGESGVIKALYDAPGREGEFDKSIFVTFNYDKINQKILNIKGNVINDIMPENYTYEIQMGSNSFNNFNIEFGEINHESKSVSIFMANDSRDPIKILTFDQIPSYMTAEAGKSELGKGDTTSITFTLHIDKLKDVWGEFNHRIHIMTSDPLMPLKIFHCHFVKKPDFSHLTKGERKIAPKVSLSETSVNFGQMKKGSKSMKEITLTNNGKSELIIYKVYAPCYCLSAEVEKMTVPPGENIKIKLTIDTIGRQPGDFSRGVTFYTNDPDNTEFIVYGNVVIQ